MRIADGVQPTGRFNSSQLLSYFTPSNCKICTRPDSSPAITAMLLSEGETAQHISENSPPQMAKHLLLFKSHSFSVSSPEAESACLPLGVIATALTEALCPSRV